MPEPKLPRKLFLRGRAYYTRVRAYGGDRWVSLGADLEIAKQRLQEYHKPEVLTPGKRLTVVAAAGRWLGSDVKARRSEKNAALATKRVEKYMAQFFAYKMLDRVTREELMQYRLWLSAPARGIKVQTVGHVLADARCFFRWAADVGLITTAPVPQRLLPRIQEQPPDRLTDDEVTAVLSVADPHAFIVRLLLATGLRWGEAVRAQAAHLERGMLVVAITKSGRVRRVPLSAELQAEIRGRVGRLVPFGVSSSGSFARAVRRASGVERFHVHQLRHTFACRWLEQGRSLEALQLLLGHESIETTQRYGQLTEKFVKAEFDRPPVETALHAGAKS